MIFNVLWTILLGVIGGIVSSLIVSRVFFIGGNKLRGNPNMTPLTGTIKYEAQGKEYEGDLFVDLEHYMTFFSATTDEKIVAVRIVQEHQMLFENAQQTYDVW